jgi:Septum formation
MSTLNPPWGDPGAPQLAMHTQSHSRPNTATPTPPTSPGHPTYSYRYPPPPKTNWWAVASFVLGLIGVIVVSVICGLVGLRQAKRGAGGRGFAIAGLVLSGLWVPPFVALIVYGATSGLISDGGVVDADDIAVGDCIAEIPQDDWVETVKTVDCRQPHAGEVFAQIAVPDGAFPGEDVIVARYGSKCEPALAGYSSTAAQDTSISLVYLHPTEDSWKHGDRAVHCIAVTLPPRKGSLKG